MRPTHVNKRERAELVEDVSKFPSRFGERRCDSALSENSLSVRPNALASVANKRASREIYHPVLVLPKTIYTINVIAALSRRAR